MRKSIIYLYVCIIILLHSCSKDDPPKGIVEDIEGNKYETVILGDQEWMAENLRTSKYRNGVDIQYLVNCTDWRYAKNGVYNYYNNDSNNIKIHGNLYNYYAVMDSNNIAPIGWHIPTQEDFEKFLNYCDKNGGADKILYDSDGFNFKSSGKIIDYPYPPCFFNINEYGYYYGYSVTSETDKTTIIFTNDFINSKKFRIGLSWGFTHGYSIRCVKD